ncbi:MAG TPA: trigger factor [Anaerolineaceae bacterium]|nr:trigger factor [Anaerolineaceae bacterium]HPT23959.1 trigger factor [Anaerolineaceae bacterium]
MKTEKIYTDDHQVKITAEFEAEMLEQFKRRAARKIAQRTRIPGFRPGKAPYNMVVNHVGEATVTQEALELMLDDVYPKVIDAEGISPWGPGNLDAVKSENPPVFEFTIPLAPETDLREIESLQKEYKPVVVSDKDVEEFIARARRSYATLVPVTTPAAEETVVYLNLEGRDANPAEGADPIVVKSGPQQALITSESEEKDQEYPYRGFARDLMGHTTDETFELTHVYAADDDDKDLAGKTVVFTVTIQSIKGLELPAMDEEFLKTMGGFDTVENLEKGVREHLQNEMTRTYDDEYYLDLIDQLREKSILKYPPQMLDEEEKNVLHRIEHDLSHRNLDLDLYLKLRKSDRDTFMAEEVKPTAKNRLERSLVMDAIVKKYDIKVKNEQLDGEVTEVVNELMRSGEFEELQKEMGSKKFAQNVSMEAANRALENAIRAQLKSIASPEPIEVKSPEAVAEVEETKPAKKAAKARKPKTGEPAQPEGDTED